MIVRPTTVGGSFAKHLLWLVDHDAPEWRIKGTAKALLGKIILSLPSDEYSRALTEIHTAFRY